MKNFHKLGCKQDNCRFQVSTTGTTCAYYPPIYDKDGVNTNPDRNTTHGTIFCHTCKSTWKYSEGYQHEKFERV